MNSRTLRFNKEMWADSLETQWRKTRVLLLENGRHPLLIDEVGGLTGMSLATWERLLQLAGSLECCCRVREAGIAGNWAAESPQSHHYDGKFLRMKFRVFGEDARGKLEVGWGDCRTVAIRHFEVADLSLFWTFLYVSGIAFYSNPLTVAFLWLFFWCNNLHQKWKEL